jgi:hypothetical protein
MTWRVEQKTLVHLHPGLLFVAARGKEQRLASLASSCIVVILVLMIEHLFAKRNALPLGHFGEKIVVDDYFLPPRVAVENESVAIKRSLSAADECSKAGNLHPNLLIALAAKHQMSLMT